MFGDKKILVLCTFGINRSRYLAEYLKSKGYNNVVYGGVQEDEDVVKEKIEGSDLIITVHPEVKDALDVHFDIGDRKVIELNVDDRTRNYTANGESLKGDEWTAFQEENVYPKLVEQIESILKA